MMQIRFTIEGNHLDITGNPIPYMRLVRGHWKKGDEKYLEWGDYVRARFQKTAYIITPPIGTNALVMRSGSEIVGISDIGNISLNTEKPITVQQLKMRLDIKIYWKNKAHGDPDNIFKGIADALIHQDKNVDGSFESAIAPDKMGRVEALLTITDQIV